MNVGLGLPRVLDCRANDQEGFDSVCPTVVKNGRTGLLTDRSSLGK
jgi:hypothetical protein